MEKSEILKSIGIDKDYDNINIHEDRGYFVFENDKGKIVYDPDREQIWIRDVNLNEVKSGYPTKEELISCINSLHTYELQNSEDSNLYSYNKILQADIYSCEFDGGTIKILVPPDDKSPNFLISIERDGEKTENIQLHKEDFDTKELPDKFESGQLNMDNIKDFIKESEADRDLDLE